MKFSTIYKVINCKLQIKLQNSFLSLINICQFNVYNIYINYHFFLYLCLTYAVYVAIGICFCYMAQDIDDLLPETGKPDIKMLIYMFFTANFLAATQDIVVDGWAMTMLKK